MKFLWSFGAQTPKDKGQTDKQHQPRYRQSLDPSPQHTGITKPKPYIISQFIGVKPSLKNIYSTDLHITVVPVKNEFNSEHWLHKERGKLASLGGIGLIEGIGFHKERGKCSCSILLAKASMSYTMDWEGEQIWTTSKSLNSKRQGAEEWTYLFPYE